MLSMYKCIYKQFICCSIIIKAFYMKHVIFLLHQTYNQRYNLCVPPQVSVFVWDAQVFKMLQARLMCMIQENPYPSREAVRQNARTSYMTENIWVWTSEFSPKRETLNADTLLSFPLKINFHKCNLPLAQKHVCVFRVYNLAQYGSDLSSLYFKYHWTVVVYISRN